MDETEIRTQALKVALDYYFHCCGENNVQIPRTQVVETARRFEEYIKDGT